MQNKKKILVVDDNPHFIELIKGIFGADYDMDTAANGLEGLGRALCFNPDLIILDVNMPGITGIEFARKLSSHRETEGIPIVVITASDYNSLTQSLLRSEHNVKLFMTKLSPIETIKEKIEEILKK